MEPFSTTVATIPAGKTRHWEIGPLEFWVSRLPGEWRIAHQRAADETMDHRWTLGEETGFPESSEFQRFIFDSDENENRITLKAEFPDRPIVTKPNVPVEIPPGCRASLFCGIPLWIRITAGKKDGLHPLTVLRVRALSKTWFGTPLDGVSCYAARTRATRYLNELSPCGFRALCPVTIINKSPDPLLLERICIRVDHLSLYQGASNLWSGEISVVKNSSHETSEVTYAEGPPSHESEANRIARPREKTAAGGILSRTFNTLR